MNSRRARRGEGKKVLTRDGKVALQVLIPKELYEAALRVAAYEYGNARGALSWLVEQALRAYISPRLHAQMHTNPPGKVRRVYEQFLSCIEELNGGYRPFEVPAKQVHTCIAEVRGSDPRTINRWINTFIRVGLMKDLTPDNPPNRKLYELI